MCTGGPGFTAEERGSVHVITLAGGDDLDAHAVERIGAELLAYVRLRDAPRLVLDLANIGHLSSAALSMVVTLKSNVEQLDGRLCLACAGPDIMRVLRLCTLDDVVDILPGVDEAVASLT